MSEPDAADPAAELVEDQEVFTADEATAVARSALSHSLGGRIYTGASFNKHAPSELRPRDIRRSGDTPWPIKRSRRARQQVR